MTCTAEQVGAAEDAGYDDGRTNREPRAWELFPRIKQRDLRAAYRKGYMRGWREHMAGKR